MESSLLPLNEFHVKKTDLIVNRLYIFLHGIALLALFYYRITTLTEIVHDNTTTTTIHLVAYVLVFISELILSFLWLLSQASKWRPVTRNVYPERLPEDNKLPAIDVFICTADPTKEPSVGVMNTVISALALDYPPDKLHVYLSDDGGSPVTLQAIREAWKFAKWWIPFCRKYQVQNRCPEAYFSAEENYGVDTELKNGEFTLEKEDIEKRYDEFKECVDKIVAGTSVAVSRDHPPMIQVISDAVSDKKEMPLLVYVAREKRRFRPHHFKAGSLNVLLRLSAMISNSPYILVLDCDMYCNDPASARQAMCFHLDIKLSLNLSFVQFPQIFHTISNSDIYDGRLRFIWENWKGMDGLRGPSLSGTGFYIKRKSLYGTLKLRQGVDLPQLQKFFGLSNEFIKTLNTDFKPNFPNDTLLRNELHLLSSCTYEDKTKWGTEVGFRYFAVVEDYFTGFSLSCEGWKSVYYEPTRPCFLGSSPISLNETLIQHTRWYFGLMQVALSRFSPLFYGTLRMSILQTMCFADLGYYALYCVPVYCLAIVPQLCLVSGISLYPEVSNPYFLVFLFVFFSSQMKQVQEALATGNAIKTWARELNIWMMKSATSYLFACFNATMEKLDLVNAAFLPTNKTVDDEQAKFYQMGIYNFQASPLFMVPICTLYTLNVGSFAVGLLKIWVTGKWNEMLIQVVIPFFATVLLYPLLEGMVLRKDKCRVSPSVSLISAFVSIMILSFAFAVSY